MLASSCEVEHLIDQLSRSTKGTFAQGTEERS